MAAFARARNTKAKSYFFKAVIEDDRITEAGKLFAFAVIAAEGDVRVMPLHFKLAGLSPELVTPARNELESHGYLGCETRDGEVVRYFLQGVTS